MSVASVQYIRITSSSSNSPSPSSSSSSTAVGFRFSGSKRWVATIRNSQADGNLRRPSIATPPVRPAAPPSPPSVSAPPETTAVGQNVVTMEFQRQKAKELQEYFKKQQLEEANQGPFFGFINKNEISNGSVVLGAKNLPSY